MGFVKLQPNNLLFGLMIFYFLLIVLAVGAEQLGMKAPLDSKLLLHNWTNRHSAYSFNMSYAPYPVLCPSTSLVRVFQQVREKEPDF